MCAEVAYLGTSKIAFLVSAHVPRPKVLAVETFLPPQILSAATDPSHLAEHDQVVVDEPEAMPDIPCIAETG